MLDTLYISAIGSDANLKAYGPSHIIQSIGKGAKPVVYCGIDTADLNWTGNPKPRTHVCVQCDERQWNCPKCRHSNTDYVTLTARPLCESCQQDFDWNDFQTSEAK